MAERLNTGYITLNDGHKMPLFGLGTWLSKPGEVTTAVEQAIDLGYRHIDCAHCYGNEDEVGIAVKNKIDSGVVTREELFITSKLWNNAHHKDNVEEALDTTLKNLKLDYVDLYLIHWPVALRFISVDERFPMKDGEPDFDNNNHYVDTWKKMVELKNSTKKLRSIGVSNFNEYQIKKIIDQTGVAPAMQQIELHPYRTMPDMVKFCHSHKIHLTAYSPLGNPGRLPVMMTGQAAIMENGLVTDLAKKYNKTAAQILIKFCTQREIVCLAKSVTKSRIASNSEIFDFKISDDDMGKLLALNDGTQYVYPERMRPSRFFPFRDNYSD